MMPKQFLSRFAVGMTAAVMLLIASQATSVQGMPQEDDDPNLRVQQLQRELQDLKSSYEKLREKKRAVDLDPFAVAEPADARSPLVGRAPLPPSSPLPATTLGWRSDRAFAVAGDHFFNATGYSVEAMNKYQVSQQKVAELTEQIRESEDDTEKEELKDQLKSELETQYDAYLERLEKPLTEMEERLDKLREQYENRKGAREEMIKLKLDTIWYEANGMGWPGGDSRFPGRYNVISGRSLPAIYSETTKPAEKAKAKPDSGR